MARRRKQSAAEDVMALVAVLPWWAGVLLAVISYLVLHPIAERPVPSAMQLGQMGAMATQMLWRTLAFYGQYRPTPTIIEAATSLYRRHSVKEITRHDAGAKNLARTAEAVAQIIEHARNHKCKAICLITGVPGAGKTLVGLEVATRFQDAASDLHSV